MAAKRGRSISNTGYGLFAGPSGGVELTGTRTVTLPRREIAATLSTRVIATGVPERTITIELDEDR